MKSSVTSTRTPNFYQLNLKEMTKTKTKFDYIYSYAEDLLKKVKVTGETYDLKTVTLSDWFNKSPTTTEIFDRMKKEGLDYCPPDAFNQVLEGLEKGEWVYLGMEPISDSDGDPSVFSVGRGGVGERWLNAYWTDSYVQWDLGGRLVFRLRKSSVSETKTLPSESLPLELPDTLTINGVVYKKLIN